MLASIPLLQRLDYHGACGHVDAEGQCFGCKHGFDETSPEESFNSFLLLWQESGVVGSNALLQGMTPLVQVKGTMVFNGDG